MTQTGIVTSPHGIASAAGLEILREGGSAVDAAIAVAATLAVVYPHMNSIGGDGFWLIAEPGHEPIGIDACGRSAAAASLALYRGAGHGFIPWRGPLAANTVAGTISGWEAARMVASRWEAPFPLERLLRDAIRFAEAGMTVTDGLAQTLTAKRGELADAPGFADVFLPNGAVPLAGAILRQPALALTLRRLAEDGLDCFYRGSLAREIAADLERLGSPVALADLEQQQAAIRRPLSVRLRNACLFNTAPPTQGFASLMILALFDRLGVEESESFDHLHGLIEATKQAFILRDREIGDPDHMTFDPQALLDDNIELDRMASGIDRRHALPWPQPPSAGDTVWFGVIDGLGRSVSAIQSTYFEFGSGCVLPRTGITWQNRGASFRLCDDGWNALRPGRKPFHTLNPAMAVLDDGRRMVYGTMGGEGQPQTQAAIFSRYMLFGQDLQEAVTAPRWLLGRTWGEESTTLKLENRFAPALVESLRRAGHAVELLPPFTNVMGHAGALVEHPGGVLEGAYDPRSDGAVCSL